MEKIKNGYHKYLSNINNISNKAKKITLAAENPDSENSFSNPKKIVPQVEFIKDISNQFEISCPANSFTILRIPCDINKTNL